MNRSADIRRDHVRPQHRAISFRMYRRLLIVALPALTQVFATDASAATINVQPSGSISSIGVALNLAQNGDTLRVESGTYFETDLLVDKPVTLEGLGWPTIDAAGMGPIFEVTSSSVSISGFIFRGVPVSFIKENAAVLVSGSSNCEIRDNKFLDNFFAIYLAKSRNCSVVHNEIVGTETELTTAGNGIHMWYCREMSVRDNFISAHRDGIYMEFVGRSSIVNNQISDNLRYGLHFMFSDSCRYERNRFTRNGAGVAVMYTNHVDMIQNTFEDSWGGASYGLLLKDIKDSRVLENQVARNSVGLMMEGSDRIQVEHNQFTNNGWAVKIMANCVGNRIFNNDFIDNSFQIATNSRQTFSSFDSNYWSPYRGFDLDHDGFGDEPYRPVSLYSLIVESDPPTLVLVRSLLVDVLDLAERIVPTMTPEALVDAKPRMRPNK